MRGLIGGVFTGGLVSVFSLGLASVVSEPPAGLTPPDAPLVEAPVVAPPVDVASGGLAIEDSTANGPSTPVGSLEIEAPQMPDLPGDEARASEPEAPAVRVDEPDAPRADTDPLDIPQVATLEGALSAPQAPSGVDVAGDLIDPVLPNPQSVAPQIPVNEADLTVQVDPEQPLLVVEPDPEIEADTADDAAVDAIGQGDATEQQGVVADAGTEVDAPAADDFFVVDLGGAAAPDQPEPAQTTRPAPDAPAAPADDNAFTAVEPGVGTLPTPRLRFGNTNTLLTDRADGVTVRRAIEAEGDDAQAAPQASALADFAADAGDTGDAPLMSIVLIDDGTMSAAAAALAGLPFPVTIALDATQPGAGELMDSYRALGFEVAVMAALPEGALPRDVEVTFGSVFGDFSEAIALLDLGTGGLQADRDVTEQAMDFLAEQGRGFISVSEGLNTAARAAEAAGVPDAEIYRDLDSDEQDARVVRRFVDQAAFRARQESGVVLVGRARPDTISALILWGTVNQDDQVAVVPVSRILLGE